MDTQLVHELFDYLPSGHLVWRVNRGTNPTAGRVAGTINKCGYTAVHTQGRYFFAHRLIWLWHHGEWPAGDIDHIDRDRQNNRIENLRPATRTENCRNSKKYSRLGGLTSSKWKGVGWHSGKGMWQANISLDKKMVYLGQFQTEDEAAAAYNAAAIKHFGDFACLNEVA